MEHVQKRPIKRYCVFLQHNRFILYFLSIFNQSLLSRVLTETKGNQAN